MKLLKLSYILSFSIFITSCGIYGNFEDGKTLGKSVNELSIAAELQPDRILKNDDHLSNYDIIPSATLSYKYGISEHLDIGMRLNSNLIVALVSKFQVMGDQQSKFSLSLGTEFHTYFGKINSFQFPVFTSYQLSKKLTLNLAPRLNLNSERFTPEYGGNIGFLYGNERLKFGVDLGIYKKIYVAPSLNFAIGVKYRFRKSKDKDANKKDTQAK